MKDFIFSPLGFILFFMIPVSIIVVIIAIIEPRPKGIPIRIENIEALCPCKDDITKE